MDNVTCLVSDFEGSKLSRASGYIYLLLTPLLGFSLVSVYLLNLSRFALLRKRGLFLNLVLFAGCLAQMGTAYDTSQGHQGIKCAFLEANIILLVGMQVIPIVIKAVVFSARLRLHRTLGEFQLDRAVQNHAGWQTNSDVGVLLASQTNKVADPHASAAHINAIMIATAPERSNTSLLSHMSDYQRTLYIDNKREPGAVGERSNGIVNNTFSQTRLSSTVVMRRNKSSSIVANRPSRMIRIMASMRNGNILMCFFLVLTMSLYLSVTWLWMKDNCFSPGCREKFHSVVVVSISGVCIIAVIVWGIKQLRYEPDPLHIWEELMLDMLILLFFGIIPEISFFITLNANDLSFQEGIERGYSYPSINIWNLGTLLLLLATFGLPLYFTFTQLAFQKTHPNFDGNNLSLEQVLASHTGRAYFKAFLVDNLSVETLLCWRDCNLYRDGFEARTEAQNRLFKKVLCETYLNANSDLQVNVSAELQNLTFHSTYNERSHPAKDDLLPLALEMLTLMRMDPFCRFQLTPLYSQLSQWEVQLPELDAADSL